MGIYKQTFSNVVSEKPHTQRMIMKNVGIFLLLVITSVLYSHAQDLSGYDSQMLEKANTAKEADFMNDTEKKVVLLTNLARMDGELFLKLIAEPYLKQNIEEETSYTRSLRKDLKRTPKLKPLEVSKDLYEPALQHATESGKTGRTGHQGFNKRTAAIMKNYATAGENCDYGNQEALDILMNLLIDEGIADVGHRMNILDSSFYYLGVAIAPHKKYGVNCVQIFAGKKN